MEKEKQIEEMAKLMFAADCSMCVSEACPAFGRGILKKEKFTCNNYLLAKALYDAGYGNVKEAVKEFAELVKIAFHYEFNDLIPAPILSKKIDELIKEVCGE